MLNIKLLFSAYLITSSCLYANLQNTGIPTSNVSVKQINTKQETSINDIEKNFEQQTKKILKNEVKRPRKLLFLSKYTLKKYYLANDYMPFWFDENGIKDISLELLEKIKLDPVIKPHATKAFKLDEVLKALASLDKSPEKYTSSMLQIDFMFTEIYDKYMNYLSHGVINWKQFKRKLNKLKRRDILADWEKYNLKINKRKLLVESIKNNNLSIAIDKANFTYPNSEKLILAIKDLEEVLQKGDYTKLPKVKKGLRLGDKSEVVKLLRQRLIQSSDLAKNCEQTLIINDLITNNIEDNPHRQTDDNIEAEVIAKQVETIDCETIFDEELKNAVISFQKNHGLLADGIVGPTTIKYLNVSAKDKIKQIRLNLERMRWLPRNLGERFLIVNIPDYKLKMYHNGEVKLDMPVVVGEKKHPTPIFSNKMSYVVLNPYWKIPKRIAQRELIPKLLNNPNYVNEKGIRIHESWDINSYQYDSYSINWQEYYAYLQNIKAMKKNKNIEPIFVNEDILTLPNLRFIQIPSNSNPLGRIKFMFPNKYSVYMHDTPSKSLFNRARRAFSHGCIRLAKPKELLKKISLYDENLNYEYANDILKNIQKKDIGLKRKIPVHIIYLTSWVDEKGKLQFREDIYKYDKMQKDLIF